MNTSLPENDPAVTQTRQLVQEYLDRAKPSDEWHRKIDTWRALYSFSHYTGEPKPGESRYADPSPTNVVDLATGIMLANPIEWRAQGWEPSLVEEKYTGHVEKYLAGLLSINSEREECLIPYEILLHFIRDGAAILYSVWDQGLADRYYTQTKIPDPKNPMGVKNIAAFTEPPIRVKVIDPRQVWLVPGAPKRWSAVIRVTKMSIYDAETMFQIQLEKYRGYAMRQKLQTEVTIKDFWRVIDRPEPMMKDGRVVMNQVLGTPEMAVQTVVENALLCEEQVVWPLRPMPGYDDLPFTIGFYKPVSRDAGGDWGHSILEPMKTSLEMLEKNINRRQREIDLFTSLPLVTRVVAGRSVDVDPVFGTKVELNTDENIEFLRWPGNPPDVELQINFQRARLQQASFADAFSAAGTGQAAGYVLSQMSDQNRIRLEQPTKHLELLWSRWAEKTLHLTAAFARGAVVRVYGQLKGRDFTEQVFTEHMDKYLVRAQFTPKFPADDIKKSAMASQARGALSLRTIQERYYGVEQTDDERERMAQDQAANNPIMQRYLVTAALTELAEEGDQAAAQTLQWMQQSEAAGQPPGPEAGPPNPTQPTGMPTSSGGFRPEEMAAPPPGQETMDVMNSMATAAPSLMGGGL